MTAGELYLFPVTFYECHACRRQLVEFSFGRVGHGAPDGRNVECRACWRERNRVLELRGSSAGLVPRGRFYQAVTLLGCE